VGKVKRKGGKKNASKKENNGCKAKEQSEETEDHDDKESISEDAGKENKEARSKR